MQENNNKKFSLLDSNSDDIRAGKFKPEKPRKAVKYSDREKKRSRRIYLIAVVAVSIILACVILPGMLYAVSESLLYELNFNETDISDFSDAAYSGAYTSDHMSASVTVSVVSGRITGISLDSYTGISPSRAREVFERVVYYQMLNIPEGDSAEIPSEPTDFIVLKAIESALSSQKYSGGVAV